MNQEVTQEGVDSPSKQKAFQFEGNVSQAWVFRCACCPTIRTMESMRGRCTIGWAKTWAREEGWSETKDGWKCKQCARRTRAR